MARVFGSFLIVMSVLLAFAFAAEPNNAINAQATAFRYLFSLQKSNDADFYCISSSPAGVSSPDLSQLLLEMLRDVKPRVVLRSQCEVRFDGVYLKTGERERGLLFYVEKLAVYPTSAYVVGGYYAGPTGGAIYHFFVLNVDGVWQGPKRPVSPDVIS